MATRNSTPTPSSAQPQASSELTLLAYDPRHEDILIGEIPVHFFAQRRLLTGLLRTGDLKPNDRETLVNALSINEQLWFALMRLAQQHHTIKSEPITIL